MPTCQAWLSVCAHCLYCPYDLLYLQAFLVPFHPSIFLFPHGIYVVALKESPCFVKSETEQYFKGVFTYK